MYEKLADLLKDYIENPIEHQVKPDDDTKHPDGDTVQRIPQEVIQAYQILNLPLSATPEQVKEKYESIKKKNKIHTWAYETIKKF